MLIYITQYFVISLLYYVKRFNDSKSINQVIYVVTLFLLVFIAGFRVNLGQDYMGYKTYTDDFYNNDIELTFIYISNSIKYLGLPINYLFAVYSLITFYFLLKIIDNYPRSIQFLIIAIFLSLPHFYFQTFNLIRQMAAVMIFVFATTIKEKGIKQILFFFLSVLFHTTAIIPVCIYFFIKKYTIKSYKYELVAYVISLLLLFVPNTIDILIKFIPVINYKHYDSYLFNDTFRQVGYAGSGVFVFINSLMTFFTILNKKKFVLSNLSIEYYFFVLGQILWNILFYDATLIRISYYFIIYYIVVFPSIINFFQIKNRIIYCYAMYFFFVSLFIYYITMPNNPYLPYQNYFY